MRANTAAQCRGLIIAAALSIIAACVCFSHAEAHSLRHHHRHTYHGRHAHHQMHHNWRFYRLHLRHRYRRAYVNFVRRYRVPRTSSDILATAERFVGDRNPTGFRGPWCGAFMGMVARITRHDIPRGFRRAISWLHAGAHVRIPHPGDLIVMRHHVTIFAGYGGRGVIGVGGNQAGHRVTASTYPLSAIVAFIHLG